MIISLAQDSGIKNLLDFVLRAKGKTIEITICDNKRTSRQNRALHLYFVLLSKALNDGGFDMRFVIKKDVDIPFTPETVKSHLWKPIMEAYLDKSSTAKLKSKDIDPIFDILNRHIGERTGIHVPFPSWNRNDNL